MQNIREAPKAPEGTWIQITFTLDHEHYHRLWQRAEEEHRTLPDLVREGMVDFLEGIKPTSPKRNVFMKKNAKVPS